MKIQLKSESVKHFKGLRELSIDFSPRTVISGANATGKTSIFDAYKWVTTDKDSHGSANFAIREHDENGKTIDNTDIVVRLTFDVDGEDITFEKTQRQKWTKRRGSTTSELTGNENLFSINDFPCSKKDFTDRLNSLIGEDIFPILTDPRAFALLPWKQQREILMRLVDDVTDDWILEQDADYSLIAGDVLEAGADRARDKYQKELKKLKADLDTYPIRIDEATHSLVDVEPADVLEKRKEAITAELEAIKVERARIAESNDEIKRISDSLMEANRQSAEYEVNANKELEDRRMRLRSKRADVERAKQEIERLNKEAEHTIESAKSVIAYNQKQYDAMGEEYLKVKASTMPADATLCPTCGRELEKEDADKIRAEFESNKKQRMQQIYDDGKHFKSLINEYTRAIKKAEAEQTKFLEQYAEKVEEIAEIDAEYKAIPERSMVRDDESYVAIQNSIVSLQDMLDRFPTYDSRKKELDEREADANECMAELAKAMTAAENNSRVQERIQELQSEQKECGQNVAEWERKMYLVDKFIEQKMTMVSDRINSKFKAVRFKLFDTLINGSVVPTCVMQINSNGSYVDVSSANNAAQIIGGLDVIETLSKLYGISAPIFIDNSESINANNIPEMDSQLILLEVTDDTELVISHI